VIRLVNSQTGRGEGFVSNDCASLEWTYFKERALSLDTGDDAAKIAKWITNHLGSELPANRVLVAQEFESALPVEQPDNG